MQQKTKLRNSFPDIDDKLNDFDFPLSLYKTRLRKYSI
jgi:hypothetical protein